MSLTRAAARALETGRWDGVVARAVSAAWGPVAARGLVRPATVPSGISVVCVGGATLGGSGKTRVAIACALELAAAGARVALVGHAYRSSVPAPRTVSVEDAQALEEVGDEAIVCARALLGWNATVVVGPTRQSAIDHAARQLPRPDVLVLDGPLRIRSPGLSLLAVDAARPWGSARLPPAGDLRAPREALMACADHLVPVDATPARVRWGAHHREPLRSLVGLRVGLFTAVGRPDRLVDALRAAGIRLHEIVSVADHGPLTEAAASRLSSSMVETWVATEKCVLHLSQASARPRLGVLESELVLPPAVLAAVLALGSRQSGARGQSAYTARLDGLDPSAIVSRRRRA